MDLRRREIEEGLRTNWAINPISTVRKCSGFYFFQSESLKNKLSNNTHGGTMPILNVGIVRNIYIPLPPIELQTQFADFITQVDKLKFTYKFNYIYKINNILQNLNTFNFTK